MRDNRAWRRKESGGVQDDDGWVRGRGLVVTVVDGRRMVAVADLEKRRAGAFAGVLVSSGLLVLVLLFLRPGLIAAGRLSLDPGHGVRRA